MQEAWTTDHTLKLADGGSLRQALDDTAAPLDWPRRIGWMLGVARGLRTLHAQLPGAIIHRDLKAANVLLSTDRTVAKIADFEIV